MDAQKYGIFISHRLEDRNLALAVSGILRLLGNKKLEPFVCTDIPGGREWRDWIDEKIGKTDILLFLYTEESFDWMWCFYEIGLFRHPSDPNPGPIICIRNSSITSLPSPLEKYQAYEATEADVKQFLEDLLYKGTFTNGDRINPEVFANDNYALAIQDFLNAFKPSKIEKKFYAKRAVFDLGNFDQDTNDEEDNTVTVVSDPYTMEEIFLSSGKITRWQDLYEKFKKEDQAAWIDQIRETIENIKKGDAIGYVMKPFISRDHKKYIPVLTRVEQMPSEDRKTIIPLKIYVIFIPCSDVEENCDLVDFSYASDPKYLLELWKTIMPTSIIRVRWKGKSSPIRYSIDDLVDTPVAYAINPSFADLYNFNYQEFPDPDGDNPLTADSLLKLIEEFIVDGDAYIQKIVDDQAEISQRIIFEGSNAFAKVPLKFNDKHPLYPNSSYLPCLVSKSTIGDINGPHLTYLGVVYVRGDWAV
ncbi:hypothetical protein DSCA_01360 [Desulfosarcina alkanivorans]|jgi:hypothetical protein|uniref:TIR domain-containing protein n=1 Tax=Desulfosarcina alkanivorans TaxID=571177 RepID=A0A5K7YBC9_9BACT|nr:toll/interleukin-1 receptor domain-containing protein [Desulfosarcina alkanivorans]BBO66206.1 hypothetical protein DSCA_01360 [Desulfosarcina alkanivorans]